MTDREYWIGRRKLEKQLLKFRKLYDETHNSIFELLEKNCAILLIQLRREKIMPIVYDEIIQDCNDEFKAQREDGVMS